MSKDKNIKGKTFKSAKQLTFTYFSIVAFAIITIHFTLLDATLEDFEQLNANNRINHAKSIAQEVFNDNDIQDLAIPPFVHAYRDKKLLPTHLKIPPVLKIDKVIELKRQSIDDTEYFLMETIMKIGNKTEIVYFLYFDDIYESSEEQIIRTQAQHLLISVVLIIISLVVVRRVADRLNSPLSQLADELENRSVNNLSPITPPNGILTKELIQLVESFNNYSERIQNLIERERSFNRYASHELRTPLMVMKGAISLLGQSDNPAFIEKQRQRLLHATNEMNDFISTLLSLTKEEDIRTLTSRKLTVDELNAIAAEHSHLLEGKQVKWEVELSGQALVKAPETTFKILLGNLIKNAFACTEEGNVIIKVKPESIQVIDTGIGLDSKPRGVEGYGLGLLIASDICRKYGWQLSHKNNEFGGCTAEIMLQPDETPKAQTE
ncbi:two-component system sensor protein [Photobacterium marinum]|uniref:histidine kinase n=1 Tax=Photobacterium marinum TaxID=1056511 RepID=L8JDU3_9GAMM|nr:HAMP domain-containing sensor histidine kinase [Photobacterium marinum]ELR65582.1 two-component system sensor protein [Photobacterium marinum]